MHGWTNSPEHRKVLLNDRYTRVGSGVFVDYYTQIYIEPTTQELEREKQDDDEETKMKNKIAKILQRNQIKPHHNRIIFK